MPSRSRNLERSLGDFLSLDLRHVGAADDWLGFARQRRSKQAAALQMRYQRQQIGRGEHFDIARPRRFGTLR